MKENKSEYKSYMQKNNEILEAWKEQFKLNGGDPNTFSEDGIMYMGEIEYDSADTQLYWRYPSDKNFSKENMLWSKCPIRFLFLTKDQNGGAWDARYETYCDPNSELDNPKVWKRFKFNKMIAYIFRGLVSVVENNYKTLQEIKDNQKSCIKVFETYPVARINCKKEGGGSLCSNQVLFNHMHKYQEYLLQQIDNLDADVLICCEHHENNNAWFGNKGLGNIFIEFLNQNGYNFEWNMNGIWIDKTRRKVAIDSYHLSYRTYPDQTMYDDIVTSFCKFYSKNRTFIKSKL